MTSRAVTLLLAAALVAVGAGLALIGLSLPAGGTEVVSRGPPVNPGATDPRDFSSHNSPTLARSPVRPSNLVVVNRIDSPIFSCALHTSPDNGATWRLGRIPFPAGEDLPERCYAPDVTFAPDGTLYLSFVTLQGVGNSPNAAWVVSSTDGGRTLSEPKRALGSLAFQVQIAADPDRAGRLYLTWLQAKDTANLGFGEAGNPIMVARSDDGGATWSEAARVTPAGRPRVLAPSIAASYEALYALYLDVGDDALDYHGGHEGRGGPPYPGRWSLVLARSNDAGATWRETVVDDQVVPTQRFIPFIPPTPSLAVDARRDGVYVGFHDGRAGDADVWVWASTDDGATFGQGVRVNDTTTGDGTDQYLPALAVAPGGRVDVAYYDRRGDPDNVKNNVSLQSSADGAATFRPHLELSDRAFDARIGPGSERDMTDLGSRLALVAGDDEALAVWSDTRAGTQASAKQDLARAVVAFTSPSPLRLVLPPFGAVVALAGAGLALIRPRKRQLPSPARTGAVRPLAGTGARSGDKGGHGR
ncbi:MAG: glycoside hydrolase [Actinobacteria bacterium]|nr:glycoside hydrolase [Actinomycetota bacterium]